MGTDRKKDGNYGFTNMSPIKITYSIWQTKICRMVCVFPAH